MYLIISLGVVSDLKMVAWMVENCSLRTTKQLFPLPLRLWILALTSTSLLAKD